MDKRKQTGRQGEAIAATYLQNKGYEIIERNWRCPTGELDLVARAGDRLVFVEVRLAAARVLAGPKKASPRPSKPG